MRGEGIDRFVSSKQLSSVSPTVGVDGVDGVGSIDGRAAATNKGGQKPLKCSSLCCC